MAKCNCYYHANTLPNIITENAQYLSLLDRLNNIIVIQCALLRILSCVPSTLIFVSAEISNSDKYHTLNKLIIPAVHETLDSKRSLCMNILKLHLLALLFFWNFSLPRQRGKLCKLILSSIIFYFSFDAIIMIKQN